MLVFFKWTTKADQKTFPLSNFAALSVECDGRVYPTGEHAFQAGKFPHLPDFQDALCSLGEGAPGFVFRLCKQRKGKVNTGMIAFRSLPVNKNGTDPVHIDADEARMKEETKRIDRAFADRVADPTSLAIAAKIDRMAAIVCSKASRHASVRTLLLSSGDGEIHETNPRDSFWAVGSGNGLNALGRLWMLVRDALRSGLKTIPPEGLDTTRLKQDAHAHGRHN
jgi:predicted NAD-dependent protein-ADP-ribosyltransferase YbiA (DUF1768 family)